NAVGSSFSHPAALDDFSKMPNLEDTGIFDNAYDDRDEDAEADYNNLETMEPKMVTQALDNESWVEAMQEKLLQFKLLNVWTLVDLPHRKRAIGTKWVYRNKRDQRGIVVRNKARLVVQGHRQEEGIDYDEVFAPVAMIESIRLFLAYASFMNYTVYQMDVKSEFLYGTIKEEVYFSQPLGFVNLQFLDKVYKVEKALYGLHQAPRAWSLSTEFEQLMHNRFQMSSMGELTFFLGLQVEQRKYGIFLSQDKYVCDILKKFGFSSVKSASTPMETHKPLSKDSDGTDVDVHLYRSMIGSLMYLTSSRPDIMFAVLWYPKDSPLELIAYSDSDYAGASLDRKSTTRGCQFLGSRLISWQCKKQTIVANSTTKAEYIAASSCRGQVLWLQNKLLDYGYNFMQTKIHVDNESAICVVKNPVYHSKTKHIEIRHNFIRDSYEKRLIEMVKIHTDSNVADLLTKAFDVTSTKVNAARFSYCCWTELILLVFFILDFINTTNGHQFTMSNRQERIGYSRANDNWRTQKDTELPQTSVPMKLGADEAVNPDEGDRVERAITTDGSLEAAHDSDNITKTQTMATPNVDIPQGIDRGGRPKRQEIIGGTSAQTRLEENIELTDTVPTPYDSPLTGGYTPGSDEGRITLAELMETCIILSIRVTQLEIELSATKAIYNKAFITLTNRVKKLESQLKQKRIKEVIHSSDEKGSSVHIEDSPKKGRIIKEMNKDENINLVSEQEEVQKIAEHSRGDDDETLAETLSNVKRSSTKDKGKGIMQETKLPNKLKKKEMIQLSLDEELAQKLYAEELAKEEARQEQERYNLEKALELQRQLDQRKESVPKEIDWNDPQNQGGYKQSYFKGMKYKDIKTLFEKIWDQVYTFAPKDSEIERDAMKRARFDLQQGSSKKQRLDQQTEETKEEAKAQGDSDQEVEELKLYIRIILEEDLAIEAIPLAIKPLVIIEYNIVKEGKISTYHIIRADGSIKRYTSMINLLKNIDREDLETLWKLVKDKYGNTRPEEGYEKVLWGDLKVMFEPDIKSEVWRQLQGHDVTVWKLFSSCGVHFVRFKNLHNFLLVDKVYPLTPATIKMMLERKLQADQWNEMCY
nr:putative ribonuclease H-like domain-containing protein [Tanacetum cinerariifolium]